MSISKSENSFENQAKNYYESKHQENKWFNKTWLIVLLCIIFFPVGLYALWKANNIKILWKVFWTVIIVLIVLNRIGSLYNEDNTAKNNLPAGNISQPIEEQKTEDIKETKSSYSKIGDEVTIGHFTYKVNKVYFAKSVGNEFARQKADGIFLIINLSLINRDDKEHTLDNSLFKLTDESDTEFESSNDGNIALEMDGKETLFLKQCNPRIQKQGFLCFEVPEKGIYDLHLSGGFWNGETTVVKLTDQ